MTTVLMKLLYVLLLNIEELVETKLLPPLQKTKNYFLLFLMLSVKC